ncbi:MAG TPA: FtsX-like permease family protein [Sumerlaeia bacterium]|nr:FtsX-like permease family protein [Sumerlaeia bacterium]
MKTVDIREQPRLSFGRTVRLTLNGIRYRLFRAAVTVVVVGVATAFLTNILSESVIRRSVARKTRDRMEEMRRGALWATRLSSSRTLEGILTAIADAGPEDPIYRETARMGALTQEEMPSFQRGARKAAAYLSFFSDLDYARLRALVKTSRGLAIFDRLGDEAEMERFAASLRGLRAVRFVTSLEEFQAFIRDWPAIEARARRVQEGYGAAIAKIQASLGERSVLRALTDAAGEFGEAIREAGLILDRETAGQVADQARRLLQKQFLEQSIAIAGLRKEIGSRLDILPTEVTADRLWRVLGSEEGASWYLEKLKKAEDRGWVAPFAPDSPPLDASRVVRLARREKEERALMRAERIQAGDAGGILGLGERMSWLLFVSMLVCGVGITNAMLMSVTARFREIATLKCLGALDGFIMLMFVLEACLLGAVGGGVGAGVGVLIGGGRMLVAFGGLVFRSAPLTDLLICCAIAVVLGVILAAAASVYPSLKASALAPMEAMRIE